MFYSDQVLCRKGPLANIWLAAHWDRKLSKAQIVSTDIETSIRKRKKCDDHLGDLIGGNLPPMALRLSGQLLLGVSKIYGRKARYLLDDAQEASGRIRLAHVPGQQLDLPQEHHRANYSAITLAAEAMSGLGGEEQLDVDLEYKQ